MKRFERLCRRFFIIDEQSVAFVEQVPQFLQEAVHTVDTVGVPRLALLQRTEEHFVKTQCVGTISFYNIVWIHNIEH